MDTITQPVTIEAPINNLIYYRCRDCLSTFTSTDNPTMCACEGTLERMGRVTWDKKRWEKTERVSVCDARCTHASGPLCNCKCNCANHGTGKTKEVVTKGGVVYIKDVDDAALTRAAEYRSLLRSVDVKYNAHPNRYLFRHSLQHARGLRVHKTRIEALQRLDAELN